MRIAYVNADPGVPVFGTKGSSIHVREIIEGFLRTGAEVDLFASRLDGDKSTGWKAVQIKAINSAAASVNSELRARLEPDVDQFDFIYERYSLWSYAAMECAREKHIPGVLEVNAPLVEEQKAYRELEDETGAEAAARRAFGAASHIVAVSEEMASYVKGIVEDTAKIRVIPNGINPTRFQCETRPACAKAAGIFTVGFVGSLRPWHGLPVLIDAFDLVARKCPEARLLIVGDGPERNSLCEKIKAKCLQEVTQLTGAVHADAVPGYLELMDVVVAPYPALPNFYFSPLKVYEYMAAARPVVASRIGQLNTLIKHGINGWHVPPGDAQALAEAILHLQRDAVLRQRLGQAARQTVLQNHTWDHVVWAIFEMTGINSAAVKSV